MDEKLQQLVDDVLLIERGYAYEKRSIKSQRQGEIFKKTAEYLTLYRKMHAKCWQITEEYLKFLRFGTQFNGY